MKVKEIFHIGGITQSISRFAVYLDRDNCVVENKRKTDDDVVLRLKRDSDQEEGNAHLRVKDEFKDIKNSLLNWAFTNTSIIGLTLNQLENIDTNIRIEKMSGKLSLFHEKI
ncbi:MAG: hypothetical protein Q8L01_02370 [Candidatus Woesebacteria bacterium]|nr:hypothetical protein [Candidatus Woesebacteria bacterium]